MNPYPFLSLNLESWILLPMKTQLYLITPPRFELSAFTEQAKQALGTGDVASLQLRMKDASDAEVLKAGEALLKLCKPLGVPLIINDRADIAKKLGADGVHLGIDDSKSQPIETVRALLGEDAVIGVSCYDSRDLAMQGADEGADYVSFGAFFPSKTKQSRGKPLPEILEWWTSIAVVPCVAIGGITPENCGVLVQNGADFLAVISAVWDAPEGAEKAVQAFTKKIREAV